jgi:hypothetical protein
MKIGVIYEPEGANSYYRAVLPMQALARKGHEIIWPKAPDQIPLREFSTCDIVHCYRRMDRFEDLRKLSQRGVAISFDNDDNFAAAETSYGRTSLEGRRYNKGLFRLVLQTAKLADVATTTTDVLAHVYRAAGIPNAVAIENYLDPHAFGFGSKSKHDGVVIGWVAGVEHRPDLARLPVVDALTRLLAAHSDLRVLSVGLKLPLPAERYEHVEGVLIHELLKVVGKFDLGIAPLADTPFNRCRSAIKLKEYGAGRAAWAASPVGPYRGLGAQEGGILVETEAWFSSLDELLRNRRRRVHLAKQALKWARNQTIDRHAEQWENAFREAANRAAQRVSTLRAP